MDQKSKKRLAKIIIHYRAIYRNGDISKRHFKMMFNELKSFVEKETWNAFVDGNNSVIDALDEVFKQNIKKYKY